MPDFEMICCVVNHEQGSKILKSAKLFGIKGGTIFHGRGTVKSKLLDFLDINDIRKEIIIMIAEKELGLSVIEILSEKFAFNKPNHGIIFSVSLKNFIGAENRKYKHKEGLVNTTVYNVIYSVVEKGLAEDVITAANEAGAKGGTIINARGAGIHETEVLFTMPIEPEKEIVMILAEDQIVDTIVKSIRKKLHIDDPGNGIIFVVGVNKTYGLYSK